MCILIVHLVCFLTSYWGWLVLPAELCWHSASLWRHCLWLKCSCFTYFSWESVSVEALIYRLWCIWVPKEVMHRFSQLAGSQSTNSVCVCVCEPPRVTPSQWSAVLLTPCGNPPKAIWVRGDKSWSVGGIWRSKIVRKQWESLLKSTKSKEHRGNREHWSGKNCSYEICNTTEYAARWSKTHNIPETLMK